MKTHGISVYPEVFKKTDLVKVLPDVVIKELKKSTNIDSQKDSYSEIRDLVTTIAHNHMTAATPMDVDTHIMSIGKVKTTKTKQRKITTASSTTIWTRKADPYATLETTQKVEGGRKFRRSILQLRLALRVSSLSFLFAFAFAPCAPAVSASVTRLPAVAGCSVEMSFRLLSFGVTSLDCNVDCITDRVRLCAALLDVCAFIVFVLRQKRFSRC